MRRHGYESHNIYVGKYDVPTNGVIELPDARWLVGQAAVHPSGLVVSDGTESEVISLILDDGDFWPVISLMTRDEASALAGRLSEAAGSITLEAKSSRRKP